MPHTERVVCAGLLGAFLIATSAGAASGSDGRARREAGPVPQIESPSTLRGFRVSVDGRDRRVGGVRLVELARLDEAAVWQCLGGRPEGEIGEEQVGQLLGKLDRSGLFASVSPTLDVPSAAGPEAPVALDVRLEENARVSRVVLKGAPAFSEASLLQALLAAPPAEDACPPRDWLARVDGEDVQPGIVWRGLGQASRRVLARLFESGYRMASLRGEWTPDGTLTLEIDEGHIESIAIEGLPEPLPREFSRALGLEPGQVFLEGDVVRGVDRLRREFPFVGRDAQPRGRPAVPQVIEEPETGGGIALRSVASEAPLASSRESTFIEIDGRRLVLHLRTANTFSAGLGIWQLMDTPATGGTLDLRGRLQLWDKRNLAHLSVDSILTVASAEPIDLQVENGQVGSRNKPREDWENQLLGFTLRLPRLRTAELGVQWYKLVDSSDSWRMSRGHSYFYEMLLNRPDSEYYTRNGFTAYWTGHFAERLTLGVEYRRDRYGSLPPVYDPISFSGDKEGFPNPAIDDGRMGSLLFRAEWSSDRVPLRSVGALVRHTETPLVADAGKAWRTGLHSLATLEIADPSLGGDERFDFTRLISDTTLTLATGQVSGVRLRARLAGGANVPRQKQQALGGWSGLRGFESNEFRGDWSLLGSLEYRYGGVGAFVDMGSVREPAGWTSAKVGLGVKMYVGKFELVTAIRTDGRSGAEPQLRVFLGRGF